jgi:hypothetical protein
MSGEMVVVSAHVLALRAQKSELLNKVNEDAKEGLFAGSPPQIALSGTRFVVKEGANKKVLDSTKIGVIVLRAKPAFDKAYYLGAFDPDEEGKAPDCFTHDGIKPVPGCDSPQAPSCAGCPRNVFGTSVNAKGEPGGGKACADNKILALSAGEVVDGKLKSYSFKVPPASLTGWNKYVQELDQRGIYLPEVITFIGFNPDKSFPQLTFAIGGTVQDDVIGMVYEAMESPEVKLIIGEKAAPLALPATLTPVVEPVVVVPEPVIIPETTFGNLTVGTSAQGVDFAAKTAEKARVKAEKAAAKAAVVVQPEELKVITPEGSPAASLGTGLGMPSDDALRASLGLS